MSSRFLTFLGALVVFVSCKKEAETASMPNTQPLNYREYLLRDLEKNYDGLIEIEAWHDREADLSKIWWQARAQLFPNPLKSTIPDFKGLRINGIEVQREPNSNRYSSAVFEQGSSPSPFGSMLLIKHDGSSTLDSFELSLQLPEALKYDSLCICSGQIIRKATFPMRWNYDLNNDSVTIILSYLGIPSASRDRNLSWVSYALPPQNHWDRGEYVISSKTLYSFPANSYMRMEAGRKNSKVLEVNGYKFLVLGSTWATRRVDVMY
ncbi:hypothetical protein MASR2M44_12170 [Bacteroidota bacterium]